MNLNNHFIRYAILYGVAFCAAGYAVAFHVAKMCIYSVNAIVYISTSSTFAYLVRGFSAVGAISRRYFFEVFYGQFKRVTAPLRATVIRTVQVVKGGYAERQASERVASHGLRGVLFTQTSAGQTMSADQSASTNVSNCAAATTTLPKDSTMLVSSGGCGDYCPAAKSFTDKVWRAWHDVSLDCNGIKYYTMQALNTSVFLGRP